MKFTTVLSVIALVAPALATPVAAPDAAVVEVEARTGGGENKCNNNQQQICCSSLIGITCVLDILGGNCNGGSYCCDNGPSTGGLININALNCVKIL